MKTTTLQTRAQRIDAALAQLERTAQAHRARWQRGRVIWAGHRFTAPRAAL